MRAMQIPQPYLVFVGDAPDALTAKTGCGLVDWKREACIGQWRFPGSGVDLGLPDMKPTQAVAAGAKTLVVGVAPFGGAIAPAWVDAIVDALRAGMNVASGMHSRLGSVPAIAEAARASGKSLFDVRHADRAFPVGTGAKRSGLRLLTVGTDCAVGKKYTALAITREMQQRGMNATYRATGQTGILIAGRGVAIDAVVADFAAGAAEWLSPANEADHWDVIEGQGSLFHPAYAGVSTALLHGSQPDAIVMCHEPSRRHLDGYPDYLLPSLEECIELNLAVAKRTNPKVRCVGISINTSQLSEDEASRTWADLKQRFDVPCFDPVTMGAATLVSSL
jgi:uncharacterized NAD-dependent epimerase/dehydratase family protein